MIAKGVGVFFILCVAFQCNFSQGLLENEEYRKSAFVEPISISKTDKHYVSKRINWKVILVAGDNAVWVFDNARKKLYTMIQEYGVKKENIVQLSRKRSELTNNVKYTSVKNLEKALKDSHISDGDGCVVYMTSHGMTNGFYIQGEGYLSPKKLNAILNTSCGNHPTILLVSSCFSGVFVQPFMRKSNRIIITAARGDKRSLGCSHNDHYTFWDACLIHNLQYAETWIDLAVRLKVCIEEMERRGSHKPSYPQAFIGRYMSKLRIFNK